MTILEALEAWLKKTGTSSWSPSEAAKLLSPLDFLSNGAPLEAFDILAPIGRPRRQPRGRLLDFFESLAKGQGLNQALAGLCFWLKSQGRPESGSAAFLQPLLQRLGRTAPDFEAKTETAFWEFLWAATGEVSFFRDLARVLLKYQRRTELLIAVKQAMKKEISPEEKRLVLEMPALAGDWEKLDQYLRKLPDLSDFIQLRRRAEFSLQAGESNENSQCYVTVISLNEESRSYRAAESLRRSAGLRPIFFPAVLGRGLPLKILRPLVKGPHSPASGRYGRGHLGCGLSHLAALELFLASGRPYALMLEEDAVPYYRFKLARLTRLLDEGLELLNVNLHRSPMFFSDSPTPTAPGEWRPLADLMAGPVPAHGSYAYLISRPGAEKMRRFHLRDGLVDYYDIQMNAYGLAEEPNSPFWWKRRVAQAWREINHAHQGAINSAALLMPLFQESGFAGSDTSPARTFN